LEVPTPVFIFLFISSFLLLKACKMCGVCSLLLDWRACHVAVATTIHEQSMNYISLRKST